MESFFGRYKNPLVLMAVLFIQVVGLATQVKRPSDPKVPNSPGTRLIRVWTVTAFTPIERTFVGIGHFFRNGWHNWIDLHGVRKQNQDLQAEVARMRLEQVRLREDAEQAQRLQALLGFRESFISQTLAAQVIGTSGTEKSRVIYIDKGIHDGIKNDMAVITPDGVVGRVKDVLPLSSQVLLINDRDSGAGVILEKSRLQGVLKGTTLGDMQVDGVMADEKVEAGERVIASGGDRIYPKGFPVGTVSSVALDRESGAFLIIKVRPAADLSRLEEVLVVTKMAEQAPTTTTATEGGRVRAADILSQRLPTVPKVDQAAAPGQGDNKKKTTATAQSNPAGTTTSKPEGASTTTKPKPKNPAAQPDQLKTEEGVKVDSASPDQKEKPKSPEEPPSGTEKPPR